MKKNQLMLSMKKYNNLLEDVTEQLYNDELKSRDRYHKKVVKRFVVTTLLLISLSLTLLYCIKVTQKETSNNQQDVLTEKTIEQHIGEAILYNDNEINDSLLFNYLKDVNAWYPEVLLAQAQIESGRYTSNVFNSANNLYGMKVVNSRFHCQTGSYFSYGCYDSWKLSVLDRLLWDLFIFDSIKPEKDDYLRALRNYAEDPNYIQTIQQTIKKNEKYY